MRGRPGASTVSAIAASAVLALWPPPPARAGDPPAAVRGGAAAGPGEGAPVPSTAFHLALRGRAEGGADALIDVMVFPGRDYVTGMLRSRGPDEVLTHVSGPFERDGPSIRAHLTGFPPPLSGCFGHGPAVSKIAEVDLVLDAGWRAGRATLSYKVGHPFDPGGAWKTAPELSLDGGEPLPWRDVADIGWSDDGPVVRDGRCFASDARERARLAGSAPDSSARMLALSATAGARLTSWSIRNGSTHHVLALVACGGGPAGHPVSVAVLLHPRETRPLYGFPSADGRTCEVSRSHLDDR